MHLKLNLIWSMDVAASTYLCLVLSELSVLHEQFWTLDHPPQYTPFTATLLEVMWDNGRFAQICRETFTNICNFNSHCVLASVSRQKSGEEQRRCLKPGAAAPAQELPALGQCALKGAPRQDCSHGATDSTTTSKTGFTGFCHRFESKAFKIAEPLR